MRILTHARATWINLTRRRDVDGALDEEIASYVALLTAEHQRAGMDAETAYRTARLAVGGMESTKEAARDAWAGNAVVVALRETRQMLRSLRRAPVYAVTIVLTLAIAIGSATALFTIVKGSLLRPLPAVKMPEQLVSIEPTRAGTLMYGFSYPDFTELRRARTLNGLALYDGTSMAVRDSLGASRAWVSYVSGDFFDVLGVRPAMGRLLDSTDAVPGTPSAVVVIGYDFWQRRFGGSHSAIGTTILLDGNPLTVIGVAPRGFIGAMATHEMELWLPVTALATLGNYQMHLSSRSEAVGRMVGRLAPGRTIGEARAELTGIAGRLAEAYVENHERSVAVYEGAGMTTEERDEATRLPRLLAIAVALLLLIACANVASLSLVRTAARRRELATRLALGASRASLLARHLLESGLLALAASAAGLALAAALVRSASLVTMVVDMKSIDLSIDWRVLFLAVAVAFVAMALVAIAPAIETWGVPAASLLRDGGGAVRRRGRAQRALVVVQVAAALVLLVTSASVFGAMRRTMRNDTGLDARGVTMTFLSPRDAGLDSARQSAFYRDVLDRVGTSPSVAGAALASTVPPARWAQPSRIFRRGGSPPPGTPLDRPDYHPVRAYVDAISPGFFDVLRVPILLGRDIAAADDARGERVVVVSKALADMLWPHENPIGQYLERPTTSETARHPLRVIGVVADVRFAGMGAPPGPAVYVPYRQSAGVGSLVLIVRGRGTTVVPDTLVRDIARLVAPGVDPGRARPLATQIDAEFSPQRRVTGWLGGFGAIALVLAAIGLYGVIAQDVLQRTREIAVRSALGASPGQLVAMVVREGGMLTLGGILAGGAASIIVIRVVHALFGEMGPIDLAATVSALVPVAGAALAASYVPARRILRLDVARNLRVD